MGGRPPLSYDIEDKCLVVNEAETVRALFRAYLELGSVRALKQWADQQGLATKRREFPSGRSDGGRPFSRGHLYRLLSNPLYIGRTAHKGATYPGEHDAIIDQAPWNADQGNPKDRRAGRTIDLDVPFSLRRRGVETKLILGARDKASRSARPDPMLVQMIAMAHRSHQILISGEAASINDLAEITGQHPSDITRLIHIAHLAPDITEAILDGRQPTELTAQRLKRLYPLPTDWSEQRQRLGMTAHVAP